MKSNEKESLHRLLEETLPAGGADCGPDREAVLGMVRRRRARRRWLNAGAMAVVLLAGVPALFFLTPGKKEAEPRVERAEAMAAPIVVEQVSDEQLLTLLQDAPVALMEWPNGERTLLVVER